MSRARSTWAAIYIAALGLAAFGGCKQTKYDKDGKPVTLGQFRVRTYPKGAKVWIDGKLEAISTPATLILNEGEYELEMKVEGGAPLKATISVEAGTSKTMTWRLPRPAPATVTVISDVEGADVRINGYRRGATPVSKAVTLPGALDITITTPRGRAKSVRDRLRISEQKVIEVNFYDTSTAAAAAPKRRATDAGTEAPRGLLTLGIRPEGAVFTDDGRRLGDTPLVKLPMEPGEHTLWLRTKDGAKEKRVTITIEPGAHAVYRFMLKKEDEVPEGRRVPSTVRKSD